MRAAGLVFGMLGLSTLPGMLVVDFYDLSLVQTLPIEQAVAVFESTEQRWGPLAVFLPTLVGVFLGIVLPGSRRGAWGSSRGGRPRCSSSGSC